MLGGGVLPDGDGVEVPPVFPPIFPVFENPPPDGSIGFIGILVSF